MHVFSVRLIDSPIAFIIVSVAAILLVVLIRRVLRWTVKLITILLLAGAVLTIALIGYWKNWYPLNSTHEPRQTPTRRATPAQH